MNKGKCLIDDDDDFNAADPKKVEKADRKQAEVRAQQLADLKQIMNSQSGRGFVWRVLTMCGLYEVSYTGDNATYFKEGRRSVALDLLADIEKYYFEQYLLMIRENLEVKYG